jgi:hypothetical protein
MLATGEWKITLRTQELSTDAVTQLHESMREQKQIDTRIRPEIDSKTPGQRLKAVIYKDWELNRNKEGDFESYYSSIMEKMIDHMKGKLPEA